MPPGLWLPGAPAGCWAPMPPGLSSQGRRVSQSSGGVYASRYAVTEYQKEVGDHIPSTGGGSSNGAEGTLTSSCYGLCQVSSLKVCRGGFRSEMPNVKKAQQSRHEEESASLISSSNHYIEVLREESARE